MKLYHISHNGIQGKIEPKSRECCEFGKGFYTSVFENDTKSGICYELEADLTNLTVYKLTNIIEWVLYVGVKRKKIDTDGYGKLKEFVRKVDSCDVIYGVIADELIGLIFDYFVDYCTSIECLIECLNNIEKQYQFVFKTDKACSVIKINDSYIVKGTSNKQELELLAKKFKSIRRKHIKKGSYLDEILEDWK